MDPLTMWLTIASIAGSVGGSAMQASSAGDARQMSDAQFQKSRDDARMKALSDFLQGTQQLDFQKSGAALQGTQLDPYAQAKSLNGLNVRKSFAAGLGPDGKFNGNVDLSAMDPSNLQKNADLFYSQMASVNPDVSVGGFSSAAEAFRQKQLEKQNSIRKAMQDYLGGIGTQGTPNIPADSLWWTSPFAFATSGRKKDIPETMQEGY